MSFKKNTRLMERRVRECLSLLKTADDALQLVSAPTQHDTGECEQATEECQGLWLGDGLHGGEASGAIGIDQNVVTYDCRFAIDGETRQMLA